ncbi:MAG: hypothetical protein JW864_15090 [Spirochaetes bacterium]|nr:hypothetical protein [Spirochaetota bacterium]
MRKIFINLIFFTVFLSCMSTDYIKIGDEQSPRNWNAEVAVFSSSMPQQRYKKIGLLRIRGGNLEKRTERAKLYTRKKGGDGIIIREIGAVTDPNTDAVIEEISPSTYETQDFLVIKLQGGLPGTESEPVHAAADSEESGITGEIPDVDVPSVPDAVPSPYASLPRATYLQLINDYKSLEGEKFKGSLYPKKIYKIPSSLKGSAEAGDKLVLLTTATGKSKVYLVVANADIPVIIDKLKVGEKLDFVYSPLSVYSTKKNRYPVIKLIESIPE